MKAVQNEDKSWSVVDSEGVVLVEGLRSRKVARETIEELKEESPATPPAPVEKDPVAPSTPVEEDAHEASPEFVEPDKEVEAGLTVSSLFELLNDVNARKDDLVKEHTPRGLTTGQSSILVNLCNWGSQPQKDLAAAVNCTPGNVTVLVDNLEKNGLVTRERDTEDRRKVLVTLTKEGEGLAKQASSAQTVIEEEFFKSTMSIPEEKIRAFAEVLLALRGN